MSSKSFTNVHLTAYPSFSYFSSVVRPSIKASRMREFTGDAEEDASWDAAGVNERDHSTIPPIIVQQMEVVAEFGVYLCVILSNGQAFRRTERDWIDRM